MSILIHIVNELMRIYIYSQYINIYIYDGGGQHNSLIPLMLRSKIMKDFLIFIFIFIFHISYLNLLRRVALRPKPFFKGPSDKNLITINS